MKWAKGKIGDHCEITSSKRIFYSQYVDSGVPFYRSKEIIELSQGKPISEPLYISFEKYNEIKTKFGVPMLGDLLLTSVGTIGIPYIVRSDDSFYFKDGNLTWFRNFDDKLLSEYVFYWIGSKEGRGILNNITIGSSQKALTISSLKQIECPLPPVDEQKHIVGILSAYDNLIENNQKQIKLLEEAAQRLYKEWFIDLRFPGHETTPIINGIPEGWTKTNIDCLCELLKTSIVPDEIESNTPYIGLEHMPRKDFCLSTWDDSSSISSNKYCFKRRNILFGKIRPYFHKVGFAITDGVASTDSFVFEPKQEIWGLFLLTVSSDAFVNYAYKTCKEGAKMPRADWNQMKEYPLLVAKESIQKQFEKNISKITKQIEVLAIQNHKLIEARDRLLPKLMSGEIEV